MTDQPLTAGRRYDDATTLLAILDDVLEQLQELGALARAVRGELEWIDRPPAPAVTTTRPGTGESDPGRRNLDLTRRQQQVLDLVAQGLSNRRISRTLRIAEQTVKAHLHMIYRKMGAADRTEAALMAMREGLAHRPVGVDAP
ncbi:hypothetical protein ALI144C_32040 [Actinosynnema sp. ALI-1.44]|uniref:helix-turn-helix transcriptional regulator n=1 Tax=Actinosynnema sp. ALI-1.44 TaxID=1933779 RepID=UPI00097C8482|nr:response regulator transcription factor [Actinosynnema sp. ALI-1.44]ONI78020.1 hypothetical protein ALI144C_32040 [Actinosynnema sp. ALI-1.44]